MTTQLFYASVIICIGMCSAAHAALYEFTLQGHVTHATAPNVAVGDPFTIRYVADTSDQDPDPTVGRYSASDAVVKLANTTITSQGIAHVSVLLDTPTMAQRVVFGDSGLPNYFFDIDFTFPANTLTSDELPLSLPLPSATPARWYVYSFIPLVSGDVTMYTSTAVPEPATGSLLLLVVALAVTRLNYLSRG